MICYAFPLAHEAELLLRRCTQKETFSIGHVRCILGNYRDRQILVAIIGMGRERSAAGAEIVFAHFRPRAFVLAGYGGALIPALKVGQVAVSGNYSTSDVVPFVKLLSGFDFASFVTADDITATPAERDRLARASRGQVVDMETSAVYDIVYPREIPFIAVRVISDEYAHVLPVRALAAGFDPARGCATPLRLLAHLALHWGEIPPFIHFVRNLGIARRALLVFLTQLHDDLPRNI